MNCKQIVLQYLKDNNYDGLFNLDGECACDLNDLMPCGDCSVDCMAGYKTPCECGDHDWHIGEQKAEAL